MTLISSHQLDNYYDNRYDTLDKRIEDAVQMSTQVSWQAMILVKGNHRRMYNLAKLYVGI